MRKDRRLGLDELMIVNPSSSQLEAAYLGEDGMLYEVRGLNEGEVFRGLGQLSLAEVSALYEVQEIGGQLFLGADGTLYEVVL